MEIVAIIVGVVVALAVGFVGGYFIAKKVVSASAEGARDKAENILDKAKNDAETIVKQAKLEAKDQKIKIKAEVEEENKERMREIHAQENRNSQREASLDKKEDSLNSKEDSLQSFQLDLDKREEKIADSEKRINIQLEHVSGMTQEEAKQELLANLKDEVTSQSAFIIRQAEEQAKLESDRKAREIVSLAIQRIASDHVSEVTVSTIPIPSDDIKGRIIGREGRNIRSFEQITGTNLIIDDSPETVTVSSFDPVRREIAAVTLKKLISDGRIQPARIEETYKKVEREVNQRVAEAGEKATFETGIHNLNPELVSTIGRLEFRTSYGQSVLSHSLEVAYLAGIMATELGLDPQAAKRAGLLHDIGKAIDHETEGSHAVIGADLAHKLGEKDDIVHAIHAHHNDIEQTTILDVLIQSADAVSAARPGSRRESLENYIKRLEQLEEIANAHEGVERTFAIQAGREVRVMVKPEVVNEDKAVVLAHDIAEQIERDMQYPGQVKVVVIRETRAEGLAK
ncbi:MAG: ribonuclease Y [Coriobacteriia bacterium]|nr:ribonuclease Y [Coriobacteriia bacterium]